MQLSETQIEQLYAFTRQHFVEYYDLQTELVDHLANAIEAESGKNPALSFDEILQSEFKKFGVFGFMDVVENRQKALTKSYHKIVWRHLLEFFKVPKIGIVAASFALVFYGLQYLKYAPEIYTVVFAILTLSLIGKLVVGTFRRSKRQLPEKRWLLEEIISGYGSAASFFIIPLQLLNAFLQSPQAMFHSTLSIYVFSGFLVLYAVFCYTITVIIPSKAKEYLAQTYPGYTLMH